MKLLLTGAEGFIGSALSQHLAMFMDVDHFEGDVRNESDWDKYKDTKYEVLVHLAGLAGVRESIEMPEIYYDNNVNGTQRALEFGKSNCHKVLYASSSNIYEWWSNPYATTKMINEAQAMSYPNAKGMRFHTVWPGRDDMLFDMLCNNKVTYINANHTRDWIHVQDLCSAIWCTIQNWYNIDQTALDYGNGTETKVLELAETVFDWKGEIRNENPSGERVHTCADIGWLLELGWQPHYDILNVDKETKIARYN